MDPKVAINYIYGSKGGYQLYIWIQRWLSTIYMDPKVAIIYIYIYIASYMDPKVAINYIYGSKGGYHIYIYTEAEEEESKFYW